MTDSSPGERNELATFLSPFVHQILVEISQECTLKTADREESYLTDNLTFNWNKIGSLLCVTGCVDIFNQSSEWVLSATKKIWPIYLQAHSVLKKSLNPEHLSNLLHRCEWTRKEKEIADNWDYFFSFDGTSSLEAVLFLTSLVERSLGNVFLVKGKNVPFLFRDLCATPELASILGPVPVLFTQILMGTPKALNLRNVAWHGFLLPGEVKPELVSTLFLLVASIGELLTELKIEPVFRSQVQEMSKRAAVFSDLEATVPISHRRVMELLASSQLVPDSHLPCWSTALHYYEKERWGWCLLLCLPSVEHILRILYCELNNCPRRILMAESSTLYTTLDQILTEYDDKGERNHVSTFLGEQAMEMIYDIFTHPAGFRVRDRLSHGEVNLEDIPRRVTHFLIILTCVVVLKKDHSETFNIDSKDKVIESMVNFTENYKTKFHISSLILGDLKTVISEIFQWDEIPLPEEISTWSETNHNHLSNLIVDLTRQLNLHTDTNRGVSSDLLSRALSRICIKTIYRPRIENEILVILKQIVDNIAIICENILQTMFSRFKLYCDRKLRSRQRVSYKRMASFVPTLRQILTCIILLVIGQLLSINSLQNFQAERLSKQTKYLRTILQFVENTASNTNESKNRIEEISQQVSPFCKKMLKMGNFLLPQLRETSL